MKEDHLSAKTFLSVVPIAKHDPSESGSAFGQRSPFPRIYLLSYLNLSRRMRATALYVIRAVRVGLRGIVTWDRSRATAYR